jgi:guanylate kinase
LSRSYVELLNISGPYGVGKDTLIGAVLAHLGPRAHRVSTLTTRQSSAADPSYTTLGSEEFAEATRGSNWIVNWQLSGTVGYATDLDEIEKAAAEGKLCVHSIYAGDSGAGELRMRLGSRLISVGVLPNSGDVDEQLSALRERLVSRGRDDLAAIEIRLQHQLESVRYVLANPQIVAQDEKTYSVFDYRVINYNLELAIAEILDIARSAHEGISVDERHD